MRAPWKAVIKERLASESIIIGKRSLLNSDIISHSRKELLYGLAKLKRLLINQFRIPLNWLLGTSENCESGVG